MPTTLPVAAVAITISAAAALVLSGCSQSVSQSTTVSSSRSGSSSGSGECDFTTWPGHLEGHGGTQIMVNNNVYVGCGGGPTISLKQVDGDTVIFAREGDQVQVTEGSTERVGPYEVHVESVRGDRVEFDLSEPGT